MRSGKPPTTRRRRFESRADPTQRDEQLGKSLGLEVPEGDEHEHSVVDAEPELSPAGVPVERRRTLVAGHVDEVGDDRHLAVEPRVQRARDRRPARTDTATTWSARDSTKRSAATWTLRFARCTIPRTPGSVDRDGAVGTVAHVGVPGPPDRRPGVGADDDVEAVAPEPAVQVRDRRRDPQRRQAHHPGPWQGEDPHESGLHAGRRGERRAEHRELVLGGAPAMRARRLLPGGDRSSVHGSMSAMRTSSAVAQGV